MSELRINTQGFEEMQNAMKLFPEQSEEIITTALHEEGGQLIHDEVKRLMPASGRKWRRKKKAAKQAESLLIETKENLSVTVKAKKGYSYLYFPDDGSNTRKHVGDKHFFERGAENKTDEILDLCIGRLISQINE